MVMVSDTVTVTGKFPAQRSIPGETEDDDKESTGIKGLYAQNKGEKRREFEAHGIEVEQIGKYFGWCPGTPAK